MHLTSDYVNPSDQSPAIGKLTCFDRYVWKDVLLIYVGSLMFSQKLPDKLRL